MSRFQVVLGLIGAFLLGGLCLLGCGLQLAWHGWQSAGWPTVTGTIINSSVMARTSSTTTRNVGKENRVASERETTRIGTVFYPEISYRYEVSGRRFEGTRLTIAEGIDSSNRADAEAIVARYAVGSTVTVFYSPHDNTLAVLQSGVSEGTKALVVLGLAWSLVFGGLLAFALSRHGRRVIEDLTGAHGRNPSERHVKSR